MHSLLKMADTYRTIESLSEGLYKEKGSKFLSFAEPVSSLDEVKERIAYYKKAYFDARHVCYAYVLGPDGDEYRVSDDGEPSGTAGRPIHGQIRSNNLTNILVVVVRYFGGILLGTGGLIVAYKEATADALTHAMIVEKDVLFERLLAFPYEKMNEVMRVMKDTQSQILEQGYENGHCTLRCMVKKPYLERVDALEY